MRCVPKHPSCWSTALIKCFDNLQLIVKHKAYMAGFEMDWNAASVLQTKGSTVVGPSFVIK